MKKAVTLEDIGRALHLSRGTVSRALNMNAVVKPETRQRVFDAAAALGFRPNRAARSLVMNKERSLAAVLYSEPAYFWREVQAGVQRAGNELRDYRIHVTSFSTDIARPEEQKRVLAELERQRVDGVALAPNDPGVVRQMIDRLVDKGIPVITVSSDVPESKRLCYVGCDYHQAGRIAGDLMGRLLRGAGRIALITFAGVVQSIKQRIAGFLEATSAFPALEIAGPFPLTRTGEETYGFVRELLRTDPGIDGIFVSYGVLEQAGAALRDAGTGRKVVLVGYDLSTEIAALIRQGAVDATICQEPFNQGYYPVKILSDLLLERLAPPLEVISTKLEIVMRENLSCYEHETSTQSMLFDI
jgi:LacI family transcriptional regulator